MAQAARTVLPVLIGSLTALLVAAASCQSGGLATTALQSTVTAEPTGFVAGDIEKLYAEISPRGRADTVDHHVRGIEFDPAMKDQIEPIYEPRVVRPSEASFLLPEELVMGVEIGGEARAYPVGMMRIREMANDTLGGVPILVSW